MPVDIKTMEEIVQKLYIAAVDRKFGSQGINALKFLLSTLQDLYKFLNPETFNKPLVVITNAISSLASQPFVPSRTFNNLSNLAAYCRESSGYHAILIELCNSNTYNVCIESHLQLDELSEDRIVYSYVSTQEEMIVKGDHLPIPNPSCGLHASVFAIPTFQALEEALDYYQWNSILTSSCQIFSTVWYGGSGNHRLFLVSKPEQWMRRSLTQYLQNVLRDANIHPEINVDESHPVDIQITWLFTNRAAIIEIKWIGDSITSTGTILKYRDARAKEGARQLAEYLNAKQTWAPNQEVKGYLVVIDARRRGLDPSLDTINNNNGFWYKDREIEFNPPYHTIRQDFAEPRRMFAKPICSPV